MNNILFDSFNARYLSFEEVVDSFVANKQYEDLKSNNHSLLMGPRGSGKTTLLKMLSPICQYMVNQSVVSKIPFWGVYIPTDIQWKRQIDYFEKNVALDTSVKTLISRTIVRTNIQIALLRTFLSILDINDLNSDSDFVFQHKFCVGLIESWNVEKPISPDLDSIELSLRNRLTKINSTINKLESGIIDKQSVVIEEYYTQDYLDLVKVGCYLFESIYKKHERFHDINFRWALCFDELEIAPSWLQSDLLDRLRSSEQNILFKLTTSPIVSLSSQINGEFGLPEARQEEDYKIIRTWVCKEYDNQSWTNFCKKLVNQKLKRRDVELDMDTIFGSDVLERNLYAAFPEADQRRQSKVKSYEKGSIHWHLFRELAITDKTFLRFLENKGISPINPVPQNAAQIDSVFRKIKPLAVFRYQLRGVFRMRSRKNTSLYYGVPFLYELCDGNPRALMALMDIFISNLRMGKSGKFNKITINLQTRIISQFSDNYLKLITAHPDANKLVKKGNYSNLGDLISVIGEFFYESIVTDPFKMDPHGSFIVDEKVPSQIVQMIELGVQLGAIIYINPDEAISENGVIGKHFRLSYLLHPVFTLPKREYNHVPLSKITNQNNTKLIKQTLLFES